MSSLTKYSFSTIGVRRSNTDLRVKRGPSKVKFRYPFLCHRLKSGDLNIRSAETVMKIKSTYVRPSSALILRRNISSVEVYISPRFI